jgi:chemotaxis protein methyltransferase CheR
MRLENVPAPNRRYGESMDVAGPGDSREKNAGSDLELELLLKQLMENIGLNLKQYKPNYLKRRIGVRMRATGSADYLQYRQFIRRDPEEGKRLINDLTINVTEFFRDQEVYEMIKSDVIPDIVRYKIDTHIFSLRAWSAGCATGEEPYSISILFLEALRAVKERENWNVRITATDLDDKAVAKAKAGIYEGVKALPGIDLEKYFFTGQDSYLVREEVKRPVKFMLLDIVNLPPLRHLDIILCRNVLIYFEKDKQHKILDIFNRCLRKGGFLVLGKSEAIIGAGESGFVPFRRKERIYIKESDSRNMAQLGGDKRRAG